MATYKTVSLTDEDIEELKEIGIDMGIDPKPPAVIRALKRRYQESMKQVEQSTGIEEKL